MEALRPHTNLLRLTNIRKSFKKNEGIVILGSNPGRVVTEISLSLPHPRDREAPEFRQVVDNIYELMTQRPRGLKAKAEAIPLSHHLPEAYVIQLAGLMEALAAEPYKGRADLPELAEHLIRYVSLAAHIRRVLDERPGNRAREDRFLRELEDFFSEDEAEKILQVAIEWGRYAELFAYEEGSGTLSLENPAERTSPQER